MDVDGIPSPSHFRSPPPFRVVLSTRCFFVGRIDSEEVKVESPSFRFFSFVVVVVVGGFLESCSVGGSFVTAGVVAIAGDVASSELPVTLSLSFSLPLPLFFKVLRFSMSSVCMSFVPLLTACFLLGVVRSSVLSRLRLGAFSIRLAASPSAPLSVSWLAVL